MKSQSSVAENRRVLIVDDNRAIHDDFRKVLAPGSDTQQSQDERIAELEALLFEDLERPRPIFPERGLDSLRYELTSVSQGSDAVRAVGEALAAGQPYALVFMDVRMPPGIDGVEAINAIWRIAPDTEAVLCTAFSDQSHDEIVARLGINDRLLFLKKPFDPVAVRQMALALTTKWNLNRQVKAQIADLESKVAAKTAELLEGSKFTALGQMAGGIAHEINTPLATIHFAAESIADACSKAYGTSHILRDDVGYIIRAANRIEAVVQSLRTFSKNERQARTAPVKVQGLIESALIFCRERFTAEDTELRVGAVPDNAWVNVRANDFTQIILNLLLNSFEAVRSLPHRWIQIDVSVQKQVTELSITDSGTALPDEVRSRLFEPFYTTKPVGSGTGLGLSIAKSLAEANGATLHYDTTSPNTRFVLGLPNA